MSDDLEPRLREAMGEKHPVPAGLRGRVIARAVAQAQRRRRPSWALQLAPALAVIVIGLAVGLIVTAPPTGREPHPSPAPTVSTPFGRLPAAGLHPAAGLGAGGSEGGPVPYYGPATMTWSGQLPAVPASAPVFRLTPPGEADVQGLQARLATSGYSFNATLDDPVAQLPLFYLNSTRSSGPGGGDAAAARAAADVELNRLGLTPPWPYAVSTSPPLMTFHYQRVVDLGGGVEAGLVDGGGDPLGIDVTVDGGGVALIQGLVPDRDEQSGRYALAPPDPRQAVNAPAQVQGAGTTPAVVLTRARLVYAVVRSGGDAYLEPAYLFTGTFSMDGHEAEKRVLVPALTASALAP